MAGKSGHRGFGYVRKLRPSGRYQASYVGPDTKRHDAETTFTAKQDAEAWLGAEQRLVATGTWTSPSQRRQAASTVPDVLTFATFAERWLAQHRQKPLKPRTRSHYRSLLDNHILPVLGPLPIEDITPETIEAWIAVTAVNAPTLRAHCYSLTRTIFNGAIAKHRQTGVTHNPCTERGAGNAERASTTEPATLEQLAMIVETMPKRYRLMVLLASWCALRFGELTELRGHDIETKKGIIQIRRGVTWVDGDAIVGKPKSKAGIRDVAIPPHLLPAVRAHLLEFGVGRNGLLFPSATTLPRTCVPRRSTRCITGPGS